MARLIALLMCVLLSPSLAADGDAIHLGVASCASSVCHGSVQPYDNSRIQQNEFITWQTDRHHSMHSKAYATLLTDESIAIARKLGLGTPEQAPECLTCHAEFVHESRRGEEFQLSDGVGCEACHGGAEYYIDLHTDRQSGRLPGGWGR